LELADTRKTIQKMKILDYLKRVKTHPTAEQVYSAIRKDLPTISLATVYRNLNLLSEQGEIAKLEVNGEFHFDADICCKSHCICKKCGKIIDIYDKDIAKYAMKQFAAGKDTGKFKPSCVSIMFTGTCSACR